MLPYKQEYIKKLEKILKEYDRAIVTVTKKPDTTKKSINNVPSFEELLDARENLEKPILFYQNRSGSKSTFIIINDKEAYVYTLSLDYSERD